MLGFGLVLFGLAAALAGLAVVRLAAAPVQVGPWLSHVLPASWQLGPNSVLPGERLAVSVRQASVQWMLFRVRGAPLRIVASDLVATRLRAPSDRLSVARLQSDLALLPLLVAQARPLRISVAGVRGTLAVNAAGWPLAAPAAPPTEPRPHAPRPWAPRPHAPRPGAPQSRAQWASRLGELSLDDARIDLAGGQDWHLDLSDLHLARTGASSVPDAGIASGWAGRFSLDLAGGAAGAAPLLHVSGAGGADGVWRLRSGAITPSGWPRRLPLGVSLPQAAASIAVTLHIAATARLGAPPLALALDLNGGAGLLGDVAIDGVSLAADLHRDARATTLDITRARLEVHDAPDLLLTGQLRADGSLHAPHIALTLASSNDDAGLPLERLPALWPRGVARDARAWVTGNMPHGRIGGLKLAVALAGPDLGRLGLAAIHGGFEVHDAEVHWLPPIAPLTGVDGEVRIDRPDRLRIDVRRGRQDDGTGQPIVLRAGRMTITGLDAAEQAAEIGVDLDGDLGAVLHLLANQRLHLLARSPLDLDGAAGRTKLHVVLGLPLRDDVRADQLSLVADAHVTGARLSAAVAGQPLDGATIDLHATQDGLRLSADGEVAYLPSHLALAMDFRAGPPDQTVLHAQLDADADRDHLMQAVRAHALGWLIAGQDQNPARLGLVYDARRDGQARLAIDADLTPLSLRLPVGWSKAPGTVAHAATTLLLDHDRLAGVDGLRIDAPDFVMRAAGSQLPDRSGVRIVATALDLGRSRLSGEVLLPADPARPDLARVDAPVIDLAPLLNQSGPTRHALDALPGSAQVGVHAAAPSGARPPGTRPRSWSVQARIGTLLLDGPAPSGETAHPAASLGAIRLSVSGTGVDLDRAHLAALRPTVLALDVDPAGHGLGIGGRVADFGALLDGLGLGRQLRQGRLVLVAQTPSRHLSAPIEGQITLDQALLAGLPALSRAAGLLSLGGLLGRAREGDATLLDRAVIPFHYEHGSVRISEARAHNPAIGVTLHGEIDLHRGSTDLHGTVVPGYLFNHLPGRLPVIGKLLSPETGGGLMAMTMRITGPLDDPDVAIDPLSILAPGALRTLLK